MGIKRSCYSCFWLQARDFTKEEEDWTEIYLITVGPFYGLRNALKCFVHQILRGLLIKYMWEHHKGNLV